jgi:hypothetical protein
MTAIKTCLRLAGTAALAAVLTLGTPSLGFARGGGHGGGGHRGGHHHHGGGCGWGCGAAIFGGLAFGSVLAYSLTRPYYYDYAPAYYAPPPYYYPPYAYPPAAYYYPPAYGYPYPYAYAPTYYAPPPVYPAPAPVGAQAPQPASPYPVTAAAPRPVAPMPAAKPAPTVYAASPYDRSVNAQPLPAMPMKQTATSVDYLALLNPVTAPKPQVWPVP